MSRAVGLFFARQFNKNCLHCCPQIQRQTGRITRYGGRVETNGLPGHELPWISTEYRLTPCYTLRPCTKSSDCSYQIYVIWIVRWISPSKRSTPSYSYVKNQVSNFFVLLYLRTDQRLCKQYTVGYILNLAGQTCNLYKKLLLFGRRGFRACNTKI